MQKRGPGNIKYEYGYSSRSSSHQYVGLSWLLGMNEMAVRTTPRMKTANPRTYFLLIKDRHLV